MGSFPEILIDPKCSSFIIAFDVRRTQHIILEFLWYSRVTFCGTHFVVHLHLLRHLESFISPGTKMLNTIFFINLTYALSNGCVAQWIMCYPYTSKVSDSIPRMLLFSFCLFCFVSFSKKKTHRKRFGASFIRK